MGSKLRGPSRIWQMGLTRYRLFKLIAHRTNDPGSASEQGRANQGVILFGE